MQQEAAQARALCHEHVGPCVSFFGPKQDLNPKLRYAVDKKPVGKCSFHILLCTSCSQNSMQY
jgi:hypothetical protein